MHEGNPASDRRGVAGGLRKTLDPVIRLLPFFAIGLVVVAVAAGWIWWRQGGAHIELVGNIQKVRTLAQEDGSMIAVLDFRVRNPADYAFWVRDVEVYATAPDGAELQGQIVTNADTDRLFQYYPALGQRYNETMLMKSRVQPSQTVDRMLAARFEMPEALFKQRRQLRIRVLETGGPVSEILERQAE
jgi:hypothetical protein